MTADVEYEVRCETAGAQPAAVISWWINGNIRLKDFVNEVSQYGVRNASFVANFLHHAENE